MKIKGIIIMSDRKIILYIAMSLDGYIARENNDISWLDIVEDPDEDYGYGKFIQPAFPEKM